MDDPNDYPIDPRSAIDPREPRRYEPSESLKRRWDEDESSIPSALAWWLSGYERD